MLTNRPQKSSRSTKVNFGRIPIYLFVCVWAVTELFVFFWMFYSSFKNTADIYRSPWSLPTSINSTGYYTDLTGTTEIHVPLGSFLLHSSIVSFGAMIGIL